MRSVVLAALLSVFLGTPVEVHVGETMAFDVGHAIGWYCDDPSLLTVQMITNGDHNEWIITGLTEGVTECRVGTSLGLPNVLFEVHVISL